MKRPKIRESLVDKIVKKSEQPSKLEALIINDLIYDQLGELLECIHNRKDYEHVMVARNILWDARKDLRDVVNDRYEVKSTDWRTLEDIEQTLTYMIDHEICYGDDYTAEVLKDLKDKYW